MAVIIMEMCQYYGLHGQSHPLVTDREVRNDGASVVIQLQTPIPEEHRDPFLFDKRRLELPGILNWALAGYRDCSERGLSPPLAVQAAKQRYRREMNSVRTWVDEECERGDNFISLNPELYASYERWCEDTGERLETRRRFFSELKALGFEAIRSGGGGPRGHRGLQVKPSQFFEAA